MAVYELRTFKDIVDAVREELKIQSTDNVTIPRIKRDVNMVYINEIVAKERWRWLRDSVDVTQFQCASGSCATTQHSRTITLSAAPASTESYKGSYFSVDEQVYKIAQHTAGSDTLELESIYTKTSATAAGYKIWTDSIPLPSDCKEVMHIFIDRDSTPLEGYGLQTFRDVAMMDRKEEGACRYYTLTDMAVPDRYEAVTGAPAVTHRESAGLLKTLTFAADPSDYYSVADRIEITGATIKTYNGRFVVSSIDSSNNQITYTGTVPLTQSSTADGGITIEAEVNETTASRFRKLLIHPSITVTAPHNIHVDYIKQTLPLEDDADEPLMPIEDRAVLLYGALHKAWARERNPEEAARNAQLFGAKIMQMRGDLDESTDHVKLKVSKNYLGAKRNRVRYPLDFKRFD